MGAQKRVRHYLGIRRGNATSLPYIIWYVIRFRGRNPFKGGGLVTPQRHKPVYYKVQRVDKQEFTN
ncbi:hypothetical protein HanXRQr2_Chr10g0458961 [Helianthus annuus]|uniref:Uncharacterized protein n=1 Tax=Helianthus annuus TaxID=4232 RepID=A0A9K3HZS6_HELAN|nr:hypothetical protein HanXRQr2_Chr10g0458961 [Helianthus annuus]KAJ0885234.1 hypothetical protein HanPSC8_Chr10g0443011 [Helianthus annuus]